MNATNIRVLIGIGLLLSGAVAGQIALRISDKYSAAAKTQYMIYSMICRPVVGDAANEFYKLHGHWPKSIKEIVSTGLLPEWSEIYLPVSVSRRDLRKPGIYSSDRSFVKSSQIAVVAHFEISPYKLIIANKDLIIRIQYTDDPKLFKDRVVHPPHDRSDQN